MNIIYITTSLEENDYVEFNKLWKVSLNPSNQNFHNKVIRALAINNHVDVISIRPFSKKKCTINKLKAEEKEFGSIHYHYLKVVDSRLLRFTRFKKQVKKLMEKLPQDSVVVTDTINPKCTYIANYLQKSFKLKTFGICTDSPSNITGTSRSYTLYLLNKCHGLDGYVTLIEGLNLLYNPNNKPHITIEGIVESKESNFDTTVEGKYLFFGGALLPRYGVYNLIEAFKKIEDKDLSLIICGHHADEEKIYASISDDNRIKFLGILPIKEVLAFEKNAIANINPRPFTQDLDRLSIPSKTLEYLASGSLTISVKNTELEKIFKQCAIWAKTGEVDDLYDAISRAISMDKEAKEKMEKLAKNTAISRYSIEKVGETITDFLTNVIS